MALVNIELAALMDVIGRDKDPEIRKTETISKERKALVDYVLRLTDDDLEYRPEEVYQGAVAIAEKGGINEEEQMILDVCKNYLGDTIRFVQKERELRGKNLETLSDDDSKFLEIYDKLSDTEKLASRARDKGYDVNGFSVPFYEARRYLKEDNHRDSLEELAKAVEHLPEKDAPGYPYKRAIEYVLDWIRFDGYSTDDCLDGAFDTLLKTAMNPFIPKESVHSVYHEIFVDKLNTDMHNHLFNEFKKTEGLLEKIIPEEIGQGDPVAAIYALSEDELTRGYEKETRRILRERNSSLSSHVKYIPSTPGKELTDKK